MENLCDVLFEVSNEDRLGILKRLGEGAMNVTGLSKELGLTSQETSRHLSRLEEVGLTQKDPDGLHHLTTYGDLTLRQLRGMAFTSRHVGYFASHTLAGIPPEFVGRMGELEECEYIDGVMVAIYNVERVIREADEYMWNIGTNYPPSVPRLIIQALRRGVKGRSIDLKDAVAPPKLREVFLDEEWVMTIGRARADGSVEERLVERNDVYLWMSEKEVAILAFPKPDGGFDLLGFTSTDERFHRWCSDLFEYYWEKAEPGWISPSPPGNG